MRGVSIGRGGAGRKPPAADGDDAVAPQVRAPRLRRVLGLGGRVLIAILSALALCELAARATGFVDRVNPFPRQLYVATEIPDLPYRLRPGVSVDVRGSKIDVNELGMRERAGVSATPPAGVDRTLVLGDSVAFGWLQDGERAFPRRLEQELNAAHGDGVAPGTRVEVLNAGVPGYNAVNEAAWFREQGEGLVPRTVLVAVNLNDYDRAPHLNGLGILSTDDDRAGPLSPANWSELYLAVRWGWLLAHKDPRIAPPANPGAGVAAPPAKDGAPQAPGEFDRFDRYVSALRKRFYHQPTEPQWSDLENAWRDLAARAKGHGMRLVFLMFPDGDQIGVADPDLEPQRRLLTLCAESGLECLDLTPAFQAAPAGTSLFRDIMHPNDAGHDVAARTVADYLRR